VTCCHGDLQADRLSSVHGAQPVSCYPVDASHNFVFGAPDGCNSTAAALNAWLDCDVERCNSGCAGPTGCTACDPGFAGARCDVCTVGHYSSSCIPCSPHCNRTAIGPNTSTCADGWAGAGACKQHGCSRNWGGPRCDDCDRFHYGPDCLRDNRPGVANYTCRHGTPSIHGITGTGRCKTCSFGWLGRDCDRGFPVCFTTTEGFGPHWRKCIAPFLFLVCIPIALLVLGGWRFRSRRMVRSQEEAPLIAGWGASPNSRTSLNPS
jgi:hypothetical protein